MGISLGQRKCRQPKHTHTHTLQSNSYYLSPMSYYSWIYDCESQGYKFVP